MTPSGYGLGQSKHAPGSPARKKPDPPVEPLQAHGIPEEAAPAVHIPAFSTTIATKQQIAALDAAEDVKPPAAELAVEQAAKLEKDVEDHTAGFSKSVASAVEVTRELLRQLRDSTSSTEVVDSLWQELEQLFEPANAAKTALPQFMEKQRDNISLYHSSMMNQTICETQVELDLQHKKLRTQHNLLLEQQEAFQNYRSRTDPSLKELKNIQECVSRLTLEKGNFKTEVDKYKAMLEQEIASKAEDRKTTDALQKELETLITSKKQLEIENETLRKTATDTLGQLKNTEQKLNKDLLKLQIEHRLLIVKYNNQTSEHAGTAARMSEQVKMIEDLTTSVDTLQRQNADLQRRVEKADKLAQANADLSKAKEELQKQLVDLKAVFSTTKDDAESARAEVQVLKENTSKVTTTGTSDKALVQKVKELEEKKKDLEVAIGDWSDLASRSYKKFKDMEPVYNDAEKHRADASQKAAKIIELERQLAAAKDEKSNGVGNAAGADVAYWKNKYETLLSSI
ncbi:hypothetical protein B5807_03350 [Epicoccum nigrum]|uniref:Uncharacterized protein n=1 Tax=Epicoccum nigrum TaxID=105696 RepID=A0A1Y2M6N9_EPING|nr:hypothetical protein B5807_03350 [Epicoccum nigrum]